MLSNQFYAIRSLLSHPDVSRDQIVAFQNKQLRRLVAHAYQNVPYYRRLFDQNCIMPKDIQTVSDLSIIPVTTKKDLQLLPAEELVTRGVNPGDLIARSTSGSSGERLTIRRTWLEERLLSLFRLRAMHYFGQRMTDKLVRIGLLRTTDPRDIQLPLRILNAFHLYRSEQINCLMPVEEIVLKLCNSNPDILTGFPGVLSQLARIVDDRDHLVIRPRFVRINSEVLTPLMRRQIAKAFACPVFDYYSCYEFRLIAWECKETGELHTCDDSIIIEIMKDGRPAAKGERGEVVGTNLHSFAMPFIRYRLGDIVTKGLETCRCGQPFSTIKAVQGRMLDYFPLPGGRMIHPYEISIPFRDVGWIRQYQLTQEREDYIIMRVVPNSTQMPQEFARRVETVTALLGPAVEFRVVLVPELRLEPSGKFRVSRSLVRSAYDGIDWNHPHDAELSFNRGRDDKPC